MNSHSSNINEYKMGLKIVMARMTGADKILEDIIMNSKDSVEVSKAKRLKQKVDACLQIIKEDK